MISLNQVTLMGVLAQDPFTNGSVTKFTVITTESYIGRDGNRQVSKNYVKCVAFGKTADALKANCHEGDTVCVEGSIKPGSFEKDGQKVYTQDVSARAIHFNAGKDAVKPGPKNVFPESSPAAMDEMTF